MGSHEPSRNRTGISSRFLLEPAARIELASAVYRTAALPLSYTGYVWHCVFDITTRYIAFVTATRLRIYYVPVYHYALADALNDIVRNGLRKRFDPKKVMGSGGDGIYVWDNRTASQSYVYDDLEIEPEKMVLVEINLEMDDSRLRMDEDSMAFLFEKELADDFEDRYPEAAAAYQQQIQSAKTTDEIQLTKIRIIDEFDIKPDKWFADYGQGGRGWPARYPGNIPLNMINAIYAYDEQTEDYTKKVWPADDAHAIASIMPENMIW